MTSLENTQRYIHTIKFMLHYKVYEGQSVFLRLSNCAEHRLPVQMECIEMDHDHAWTVELPFMSNAKPNQIISYSYFVAVTDNYQLIDHKVNWHQQDTEMIQTFKREIYINRYTILNDFCHKKDRVPQINEIDQIIVIDICGTFRKSNEDDVPQGRAIYAFDLNENVDDISGDDFLRLLRLSRQRRKGRRDLWTGQFVFKVSQIQARLGRIAFGILQSYYYKRMRRFWRMYIDGKQIPGTPAEVLQKLSAEGFDVKIKITKDNVDKVLLSSLKDQEDTRIKKLFVYTVTEDIKNDAERIFEVYVVSSVFGKVRMIRSKANQLIWQGYVTILESDLQQLDFFFEVNFLDEVVFISPPQIIQKPILRSTQTQHIHSQCRSMNRLISPIQRRNDVYYGWTNGYKSYHHYGPSVAYQTNIIANGTFRNVKFNYENYNYRPSTYIHPSPTPSNNGSSSTYGFNHSSTSSSYSFGSTGSHSKEANYSFIAPNTIYHSQSSSAKSPNPSSISQSKSSYIAPKKTPTSSSGAKSQNTSKRSERTISSRAEKRKIYQAPSTPTHFESKNTNIYYLDECVGKISQDNPIKDKIEQISSRTSQIFNSADQQIDKMLSSISTILSVTKSQINNFKIKNMVQIPKITLELIEQKQIEEIEETLERFKNKFKEQHPNINQKLNDLYELRKNQERSDKSKLKNNFHILAVKILVAIKNWAIGGYKRAQEEKIFNILDEYVDFKTLKNTDILGCCYWIQLQTLAKGYQNKVQHKPCQERFQNKFNEQKWIVPLIDLTEIQCKAMSLFTILRGLIDLDYSYFKTYGAQHNVALNYNDNFQNVMRCMVNYGLIYSIIRSYYPQIQLFTGFLCSEFGKLCQQSSGFLTSKDLTTIRDLYVAENQITDKEIDILDQQNIQGQRQLMGSLDKMIQQNTNAAQLINAIQIEFIDIEKLKQSLAANKDKILKIKVLMDEQDQFNQYVDDIDRVRNVEQKFTKVRDMGNHRYIKTAQQYVSIPL